VALFAALWLVVALAVVALQFSLEARDRRLTASNTLEIADARAVATAGIEHGLARLERARRQPTLTGGSSAASMRAADPWLDPETFFAIDDTLGGGRYIVEVHDVGATLNINSATEQEIRALLIALDFDGLTADDVSRCIMDWRDTNILPRSRGAERDQYLDDDRLVLPRDGPFQTVPELLHVMNVTQEIYDSIAPFLRVDGAAQINVNSAPDAVLQTLPGMSRGAAETVVRIRQQGRRITSMNELRQLTGIANINNNRVIFMTTEVRVTSTGWNQGRHTAVRIDALVQGSGTGNSATARVISRRSL
jgi:general secretion pathway protein K